MQNLIVRPSDHPPVASDGGKRTPAAGSPEEALETARSVGFPGALVGLTCRDIERLIRNGLLWES